MDRFAAEQLTMSAGGSLDRQRPARRRAARLRGRPGRGPQRRPQPDAARQRHAGGGLARMSRRRLATARSAHRAPAVDRGRELVTTRLDQRKAGEDVEVPWTLPELRREWNRAKHEVAPWWAENSKEAYSSGLDALARALKNWSDSRSGRRKGRPMGFPRRKKKRRARAACRFTTGPLRVLPDRKHIQLPRIGVVKTHDALHKLTTSLATQHGTVVVEHLNVAGMLHNRRLARAVTDTGLAELRRQLGY